MDDVFVSVEQAIQAIKQGEFLIVVDDEDRENEGDFIMAAEKITPEAINFLTKFGRGLICQAIEPKRAEALDLKHMVQENSSFHNTAFTISVDARDGTTTGISAFDRAQTIKTIISPHTSPDHLLRPGHIFPLIAKEGGVLERDGHTEATVDLARLAGLYPSGVLCEIMDEDGTMAKLPRLEEVAKQKGIPIFKISDLIAYRKRCLVKRAEIINLPTELGEFQLIAYENESNKHDAPFALKKGKVSSEEPVLVRVHSECFTGESLLSNKCDCGYQLHQAMQLIQENGGVLVYLRQEGRGIGFLNKMRAYALQEAGYDTVEANLKLGFQADERDYAVAAEILKDLKVRTVRLLTNNPDKIRGLQNNGIMVEERISLECEPFPENIHYMSTKKERFGHLLEQV